MVRSLRFSASAMCSYYLPLQSINLAIQDVESVFGEYENIALTSPSYPQIRFGTVKTTQWIKLLLSFGVYHRIWNA